MTPIISELFVSKYVEYFSRLLEHYEKEEGEIFTYLVNSIKSDLDSVIDRIKSSIEFMTFYYAVRDLEKKKGLIKKEEILTEVKNYAERLKKYVECFNFPNEVTFSCIFNIEDLIKNKSMKESVPVILDNPENFRKFFCSETRSYLVGTIKKMIKKIDDVGIFSLYVKSSNRSAKNNNLSVLMIEEGENEKEDFIKTIKMLKNKENNFFPSTAKEVFYDAWLDKQSLEQLIYMNLFWANKFAKLIEDLCILLLLFSKRKNLLEGIRKNEINFEVLMYWLNHESLTKKDINALLSELRIIYNMSKEEVEKQNNGFINDFFFEDIYKLMPIYNYAGVCYTLKKMSIFYALEVLESDREVKNYGIVQQEKRSLMATFIIDVPRYNLPISFHIEVKSLYIFYKEFLNKEKIRKYIGLEDFYSEERKWGNSFLYPLSKSQREYIYKVKDINNKFAHLDFLQRRIWPKHMKDSKGNPLKEFIKVESLKI